MGRCQVRRAEGAREVGGHPKEVRGHPDQKGPSPVSTVAVAAAAAHQTAEPAQDLRGILDSAPRAPAPWPTARVPPLVRMRKPGLRAQPWN